MDGSSYALVVASDHYDDPALRQLRSPTQDAEALADVLADPDVGGFDVRTLLNQPAHVVDEQVEAFFADRLRDDLLLLYFSCHGIKDDTGRLYFASTDTKLNRLAATGISSVFVNEQLDRSRSRKIVLLLDCCYSGAFTRGLAAKAAPTVDVQDRLQGRGRVVITASTAMEYAFDGSSQSRTGEGVPSLFTSAVIDGLRTGQADVDGNGLVSVEELYDYVYEKVREANPGQTPSMISNLEGELFLARAAAGTVKAALAPAPPPRQEPAEPATPAKPQGWRSPTGLLVAGAVAVLAVVLTLVVVALMGGDDGDGSDTATSGPTIATTAPTTPSPSSSGEQGVLSQGTATLGDPTQGLDLVQGTVVIVFRSNLAWFPLTSELSVFDDTTLGATLLGDVDFDALTADDLAQLSYGTGADNPALPKSQLPVGTVIAVHVQPDVYAKVRVDDYPAGDAIQLRWVTE